MSVNLPNFVSSMTYSRIPNVQRALERQKAQESDAFQKAAKEFMIWLREKNNIAEKLGNNQEVGDAATVLSKSA